ncbi:MAG: diguanylate cyclase [Clostridia bacterium]|nr:diguanylate cyclase [Clostridia bacterium]
MTTLLIILLIVIAFLLLIVFKMNNDIKYYRVVSKNLSAMRVIQSMFEIMGANIPAENKIKELNKVIIDTYSPKYSTIVTYDGTNHIVEATNIDVDFGNALATLGDANEFRGNVLKNVSKYITTSSDKTLGYKTAAERNVRSCMLSPIYHNNTYLGYWIIEDEVENAFDSLSKSEVAKLKNNMGVFLENTLYQNMIEAAENTDKQTGFYNSIFLYSKAKKKIAEFENNTITFLQIANLADINAKYSREVGNKVLAKAVSVIKELIGNETMVVRYSGTKFVIVYPNSTAETLHANVERMLARIKSDAIEKVDVDFVVLNIQIVMTTFKKQNNLEKEVERMKDYVEKMKEMDTIKII